MRVQNLDKKLDTCAACRYNGCGEVFQRYTSGSGRYRCCLKRKICKEIAKYLPVKANSVDFFYAVWYKIFMISIYAWVNRGEHVPPPAAWRTMRFGERV